MLPSKKMISKVALEMFDDADSNSENSVKDLIYQYEARKKKRNACKVFNTIQTMKTAIAENRVQNERKKKVFQVSNHSKVKESLIVPVKDTIRQFEAPKKPTVNRPPSYHQQHYPANDIELDTKVESIVYNFEAMRRKKGTAKLPARAESFDMNKPTVGEVVYETIPQIGATLGKFEQLRFISKEPKMRQDLLVNRAKCF